MWNYSSFRHVFIFTGLIFLFIVTPLILSCGSGGGGGDSENGDGVDDTNISLSEVTDFWQFYFTKTGENEEIGEIIYLSIEDGELECLTEYEGAVARNTINIQGTDISFMYQVDQADRALKGILNKGVMSGTWIDNYSSQAGTWRAIKVVQQIQKLTPIIYEAGDAPMVWNSDDDTVLVSFYGEIPQNDDEPVFTDIVIAVEDEVMDIRLDDEERIIYLTDGSIELVLTYNNDGSFNYELYSDGYLVYGGSYMTYPSILSTINKDPEHTKINRQNDQIALSDENIGIFSEPKTFNEQIIQYQKAITLTLYKNFEKYRIKQNLYMKSGFYGYLISNKAFQQMAERVSVLALLYYKRFDTLNAECASSIFPKKCNTYINKVNQRWRIFNDILVETLWGIVVRLHEEYEGNLCSDVDEDTFPALKDCGNKVDCDDNSKSINPKANEICNDGLDNNCDGKTDCDDTACSDDDACKSSTSDCSKEYTQYHEEEMTLNRYCGFGSEGGLICSRYDFSGCANACVSTDKYPPGAASVFNLWTCSSYSGYASCASSAFSAYVGCLEACNADFLAGEWGTEWGAEFYILHNVCAPECQDQINQVLNNQCVAK